jgi:hypothetical protein
MLGEVAKLTVLRTLANDSRYSGNPYSSSLNDLICGRQQRFWDVETERLGGLEIDDQLDFYRLLHREVGRFLTFEDARGINASLVRQIAEAAAIAHQTAGSCAAEREVPSVANLSVLSTGPKTNFKVSFPGV